jgi:hypothetical protein
VRHEVIFIHLSRFQKVWTELPGTEVAFGILKNLAGLGRVIFLYIISRRNIFGAK